MKEIFSSYIVFLLISLGLSFEGSSQIEQTTIQCLEVLPDGSVGITWEQINDPNGIFLQYQIARHNTGDQTNLNISIIGDINGTYFIDAGVDANVTPASYQILTVGTDSSTEFSPVLSSILLAGTFNAGIATFTWTDPIPNYSSLPAGTTYHLMAEYPVGTWMEVASFPYAEGLNGFDYPVAICDALVNFRMELQIPGASCQSSSNLVQLQVEDSTAPSVPEMTSISVDSISGNAIVDWNSVPQDDCGGYIVYLCNGISAIPIETIFDSDETEYIYPSSDAQIFSEHYLVASFDTCTVINPDGNTSPTEDLCPFIHSSIHLNNSWVTCQNFIDLNWNLYTGWEDDGVAFQEVFRSDNGAAPEVIAVLEEDNEFFRDNNIEDNHEYCYHIKAYSATVNNANAISNISCTLVAAPPTPNNFGLFTATVSSPDEIAVIVNTEPTTTFFDYVLRRKSENEPFFFEIDNVISNSQNLLGFSDQDVEPSIFFYDYQIGVVNQCNDTVLVSNLGRTIKLQGLANSETLINTITWNAYESWLNGVDSYEIYRTIDGGAPELVGVNGPNILYYEDDVSNLLDSKGEFCYYIVAQEADNGSGLQAESFSNILCLSQPPKIWIPNAFAVNGINNTFFPTISFADRDSYILTIYNRWGQEIYTSFDIEEGWDGTKNGNLIQEGTYMYFMEIKDGSGRVHEFRGPVTLLIFDAN